MDGLTSAQGRRHPRCHMVEPARRTPTRTQKDKSDPLCSPAHCGSAKPPTGDRSNPNPPSDARRNRLHNRSQGGGWSPEPKLTPGTRIIKKHNPVPVSLEGRAEITLAHGHFSRILGLLLPSAEAPAETSVPPSFKNRLRFQLLAERKLLTLVL